MTVKKPANKVLPRSLPVAPEGRPARPVRRTPAQLAADAVRDAAAQVWQQVAGRVVGSTLAGVRALALQAGQDLQALLLTAPEADADGRLACEVAMARLMADFASPTEAFETLAEAALLQARQAGVRHREAEVWALRAFVNGLRDDYDNLARCARLALGLNPPGHALAPVYAHLALAGALHAVGEFQRTAVHFGPALACARASGDDFLCLLAQRQLALCQAKEARELWSRGEATAPVLWQTEADLRTVVQMLQARAAAASVSFMNLFLAETLALQSRHEEALALFDQHLAAVQATGPAALVAIALARQAGCLMALGRAEAAQAASAASLQAADQQPDPEVQALVHGQRAALLRQLDQAEEAAVHSALHLQAQARQHALRESCRDSLLKALDGLARG